jgi:hypothetical protein
MNEAVVRRAAEFFWKQAGGDEPFPRSLETPASWGLPIAIVKLPRLWVEDAQAELLRYGISWVGPAAAVCLRGLMLAARGRGFLFINGSDPPSEQRYSLAHEIAHFLLDYYLPRLDAVAKLGPGILDVLDGDRQPTMRERVHASLSAARIGTYEHIARREPQLTLPDREDAADALAVELLAPQQAVWRRLQGGMTDLSGNACGEYLRELLTEHFGLPDFAATGTADLLARRWQRTPSFRQWMGMKSSRAVELLGRGRKSK